MELVIKRRHGGYIIRYKTDVYGIGQHFYYGWRKEEAIAAFLQASPYRDKQR